MMYILYSSDGSIKAKLLNEYIQQGNHGVNQIFVSIANYPTGNFTLNADVILPNKVKTTLYGVTDTQTIEGVTYTGKTITLTRLETAIAGVIQLIIEASDVNVVLATYPVVLTVNETGLQATDPITITKGEYTNLLNSFLKLTGGTITGSISAGSGNFAALYVNNKQVATQEWVGNNATKLYKHVGTIKLENETNPRNFRVITTDSTPFTTSFTFANWIQAFLSKEYPWDAYGGGYMSETSSGVAVLKFGTIGQIDPNSEFLSDTVTAL